MRDRLAFAAFAMLWGAQIAAANMTRLAGDTASLTFWAHLYHLLIVLLYYPLVVFALLHVVPSRPWLRGRASMTLLAVPAAVVLAVFAVAPQLFVAGVALDPSTGAPAVAYGPLRPLLSYAHFLGAYAAFALAFQKYLTAPSAPQRARLSFVVAALACFVAYISAQAVAFAALAPWFPALRFVDLPLLALFGGGLLLLGAFAVRVARAPAGALPHRSLVLALLAVPAIVGVADAGVFALGVRGAETLGLWRLLMVGLIVYGIARYQVFDIELRLSSAAPAVVYVCATVALVAALAWLLWGPIVHLPVVGAALLVGAVASLAPLPRLTRRALDHAVPWVGHKSEYVYRRKVEVYRSALEEARVRGMGRDTEEAFLSELRRGLGLSEREHRLLLLLVDQEHRAAETASGRWSGRFRVDREIGRGGFGRALLAHDLLLDRRVVLKELAAPWLVEDHARELFLREARLAAAIAHPNVVTIYEVMPGREPPVIVMEYVEGGSLEDLLRGGGALDPARAVRIAREVLSGLQEIHRAGIIHRDLKPANILLTRDGTAKITDFGVAHRDRDVERLTRVTSGGAQPGTLLYMSPEQVAGGQVDARSDLYAVGVILYRMLAGRHHLDTRRLDEFRMREAILAAPPPPPVDGVFGGLHAVLVRAMAKDAAARFGSAAEMAAALASGETSPLAAVGTDARRGASAP